MKIGLRLGVLVSASLVAVCACSYAADESIKATIVADALDNPCGVTINPKTGHLYIAAHTGVYAQIPGDKKLHTIANGFGTDIYGKGPKYNIGPLGVAFMSDTELVVGDGSKPDGEELVYVFDAKEAPGTKTQKPGDAKYTLGPIKAGAESAKGEGNFYGVAVTDSAIFITCNGDDTKGWIAKSDIANGKPGDLKPFIATKVATGVDAPVGITVSPKGQLAVGQMGEINVPGDSLLTFYDPNSGKMLQNYKTGLNDIAGVAYSPKTGKLYVVDYSWVDTTKGGLFHIDIQGDKVTANKVLSLDKPTALAFDKEGRLYISLLGNVQEGGKPAGQVVRIDPGL